MKIAMLVHGGVDRSGEERVIPALLWLIERLARRNEVHVFAREQEHEPGEWELLGARVHNIGMTPGRRTRLLSTFACEHHRAPFDVLQGLFGWGGMWGTVLGARHRIPLTFHATGGEFVALRDIGYGTQLSLKGGIALSVATRGAEVVTVPTEFMRTLASNHHVRARVIPLGVDIDRWPPRAPRPRDASRPARLLHVGDIRPVKDHGMLLKALGEMQGRGIRAEMDLCGYDTLGGTLQASTDALQLAPNIRWHGVVGRSALRMLMEQADVLVVSSRHEAEPLVVLEAAIAGVPTVGTAVGHVGDWAPQASVAVPVSEPRALADALVAILSDDARRLAIANEAQRRALTIDADYTASSFEQLYAEITRR